MNKLSTFNGVPEMLEDLAKQIDAFGGPESHGSYPAAWAYATSTPFTYGKEVTSGGGCSTAMAIHWPVGIKHQGSIGRQFHHLIDVAPTILECAGVPEPTRVNGVDQKPMEGVSMRYTFDDATATDRHTTQYFELLGGRAIYQDGWWAGTRHGVDGVTAAHGGTPFDEDVWRSTTREPTSDMQTIWPPSTRRSSPSYKFSSTARRASTTSIRWPTTSGNS
jgi:arylsulfatase A-like enzyme